MSEQDYVRFGELKIFMHQIYEFKKGVRNLVLCTMCPTCAALVRTASGAADRVPDSGSDGQ